MTAGEITRDELGLAARNHALPLEALRFDITPAGLHYILTHYDMPLVDEAAWRLEIGGGVAHPLSLSLADLRAREHVRAPVTMECAGNGRSLLEPRPISQPWALEAIGTAEWGGTPLAPLLEEAEPDASAAEVVFSGLDRGLEGGEAQHYERSLALADALHHDVLLAYEMNGAPLPPQHGYPVRLLVPGWYGMTSVKWLARITVLDGPFDGYQHRRAYRLRLTEDDPGEPVTRIAPRALMVPPGIPDFLTRARHAPPGEHVLEGRAWSGRAPVVAVEVSTDGGATWEPAELDEQLGPAAWARWRFRWDAEPGDHVLCCRARDAAGNEQPLEPAWNVGGYANNAVQRVAVSVAPT